MKHVAIEKLYKVFSKYKLKEIIIGCHCPLCMDDEYDKFLQNTPLAEITAKNLFGYLQSANILDENCKDFKYFIPRILELIFEDSPENDWIDFIWKIIAQAEYHSWENHESEAVDCFFKAYWNEIKNTGDEERINWTRNDFKVIKFINFEDA